MPAASGGCSDVLIECEVLYRRAIDEVFDDDARGAIERIDVVDRRGAFSVRPRGQCSVDSPAKQISPWALASMGATQGRRAGAIDPVADTSSGSSMVRRAGSSGVVPSSRGQYLFQSTEADLIEGRRCGFNVHHGHALAEFLEYRRPPDARAPPQHMRVVRTGLQVVPDARDQILATEQRREAPSRRHAGRRKGGHPGHGFGPLLRAGNLVGGPSNGP